MTTYNHIDTHDDGDIIDELRLLKARLDAGVITRTQYDIAFDQINRSVGVRCSRCNTPPAVIQEGSAVLCGPCARNAQQNARIGRRTHTLSWVVVSAALILLLSIGLALIYVASL